MRPDASGPIDLAIVIVSYNTSALLRNCLNSVLASEGGLSLAVCVVDNASPDDSAAMVRAEFPQVQLIANVANAGYPRANNQGLRYFGFCDAGEDGPPLLSLPRFALLLNPDTVLPPTALADMLTFMQSHPSAGAAGPKLVRLDGSLDKACRRSFPTPTTSLYHMAQLDRLFPHSARFARYDLTYLDPDEVAQVDAIVGAFMLVRREALAQVGLLDERFFMYGEDLDWAKRITDAGWEVWYNPQVVVTHIKEAASRYSYRARVEFYRALTLFYEKHYRSTTPFYMDWLIRSGIGVFGGVDLTRRRLQGRYRTPARPPA
jgi:GT2 family glycosyltransferase